MIFPRTRYFIDSNIFLYCAGDKGELKSACLKILQEIEQAGSLIVTSVAVLEEVHFLFYRQSKNRKATTSFLKELVGSVGLILPWTWEDYELALRLFQRVSMPLRSIKDFYHVASMMNHDIQWIVSNDSDFDHFDGIHRFDPLRDVS